MSDHESGVKKVEFIPVQVGMSFRRIPSSHI